MLNPKALGVAVFAVAVALFVAIRAQPKDAKPAALTALDYAEIEQLNTHYSHAIDTCADKGNEFADLFAPDGVYVYGDGRKVQGREKLAAIAGGPNCAPPKNSPLNMHHVFVNMMIEPSSEGAIGKSYYLAVSVGETGKPGQLLDGAKVYDVYTKTPAGWRFKSRSYVHAPRTDLIPASELSRHPTSH